MLGLAGAPCTEFPQHVREVMDLGVAYENATRQILVARLGNQLLSDVPVGNAIWSGRMDFLITRPDAVPVIVEHKGTGDAHFDYNFTLPKFEHVCQTWLYSQLYREKYNVTPQIILYYRAWGVRRSSSCLRGRN